MDNPDWHRISRKALADGAKERIEVLWLNELASSLLPHENLFDRRNS